MSGQLAVNTCSLDSFEGLHNAIRGSHVEVTQLGRGKFRGSLSHVGIGDFSLSIGSFSVGVRTQRVSTDDKLVIGMLLNADDRVTHWSFDMRPADVLIMPPSTEHDGIFHGASAYAAIRLDIAEVPSLFKGEPRLSDPAAWLTKNVYQADPSIGMAATRRLPLIISRLARQQTALSDTAADFWKRSIIDAVTGTIVQSLPPDTRGLLAFGNATGWRKSTTISKPPAFAPCTFPKSAPTSTCRDGLCIAHFTTFSVWDRYVPASQAALRHSFRSEGKRSCDGHRRAGGDPARLHRAWTLLPLLSFAVRGISIGNAWRPRIPRAQGDRSRFRRTRFDR